MPLALTLFGLAIVAAGLFVIRAIRKFGMVQNRAFAPLQLNEQTIL
jgi:hypothetical protein